MYYYLKAFPLKFNEIFYPLWAKSWVPKLSVTGSAATSAKQALQYGYFELPALSLTAATNHRIKTRAQLCTA